MTIPKECIPHIPPTQKQLDFIKIIEDYGAEAFTGTTKAEASYYISNNKDLLEVPMSEWHANYM